MLEVACGGVAKEHRKKAAFTLIRLLSMMGLLACGLGPDRTSKHCRAEKVGKAAKFSLDLSESPVQGCVLVKHQSGGTAIQAKRAKGVSVGCLEGIKCSK